MEVVCYSDNVSDIVNKYWSMFEGKKPIMEMKVWESVDSDSFKHADAYFDEPITADLFAEYPLHALVRKTITFSTLHELVTEIRNLYKEIYEVEDETKTEEVKVNPQLINRGVSNGKLGIWGHHIGDLCIEEIALYEGERIPIIQMFIGS